MNFHQNILLNNFLIDMQYLDNVANIFLGKRSCPGEPFARSEVFMYLVCIMQKFHVSLPEGAVPDFEGVLGLSLAPKPFEICIKKRR
ncbi:hypothetical protein AVEN_104012-1 [Araneus ventricosus]|uniref:Uncharacterized protein n=1 Tax=Araneus ventricosus TaxID=182803 RepID=A0A4Y2PRY1_ARAVE|nr:hypothetical protein AVEN_224554-1 [Araneus ventricosus]GBN54635.1 hypothetical protein AVEN_155693-1 [Araneus ventricosus]GBN61553.1 hypothetical protein AVEN_75703-1 [Araneus ventricosus]GBN61575.1 hypothetical protein AVEN_104012-1 [Araneus ventricosus]